MLLIYQATARDEIKVIGRSVSDAREKRRDLVCRDVSGRKFHLLPSAGGRRRRAAAAAAALRRRVAPRRCCRRAPQGGAAEPARRRSTSGRVAALLPDRRRGVDPVPGRRSARVDDARGSGVRRHAVASGQRAVSAGSRRRDVIAGDVIAVADVVAAAAR